MQLKSIGIVMSAASLLVAVSSCDFTGGGGNGGPANGGSPGVPAAGPGVASLPSSRGDGGPSPESAKVSRGIAAIPEGNGGPPPMMRRVDLNESQKLKNSTLLENRSKDMRTIDKTAAEEMSKRAATGP